jgi:LPXTG-motif cell wall-anchored protein
MHEASHAWFNPELFVDRWVFEGLAEEYSWRTQSNLGEEPPYGPEQPSAGDPGKVALEYWGYPEAIRDQETDDVERYGYGASFWVVHTIVEAAGLERMREVFDAAERHAIAYVGAPAPETLTGDNDWRRLVDLAEPIGEPDTPAVEAALKELVLQSGNAPIIDQRHDAREAYRELVAAGAGWLPPAVVRQPMSDWKFYDAGKAMDAANAVLARRDEVAAAAAALGLTPDKTLRNAYESASVSFDAANQVATNQLDAVTAVSGAKAAMDAPVDLVAQLGLLGSTAPAAAYDAAAAAFEQGDLPAATASAGTVATLLAGAVALGEERMMTAVAVGIALLVLVAALVVLRRRRRRGRLAALALAAATPEATIALETAAGEAPGSPPDGGPPQPPEWPAADFLPPPPATPPEPAWWLPTRSSADPGRTDPATLAADPDPSPPPGASPPDLEGDLSAGESPSDA